jgi:flagellar protein FlbD
MIKLTRLSHIPLIVNSDLIEHIEETPDTVITLTSGQKFMVRESAEEVVVRRSLAAPVVDRSMVGSARESSDGRQ